MALLDRFRQRPGWEDPDPDVRQQAVLQLAAADQELLASIARGDDQAAVRRAAVRKLSDPELLVSLSREDEDDSVREEAAQVLLRLAQGGEPAPARVALAALQQPRHLVAVAREARTPELRREALERLEDARSLAGVAKTARDAAIRQAALARVGDAELLADVAAKSSHRDVAVAALERVEDLDVLHEIAAHARHKAAARRARARLEELTGAPQPITAEERRNTDHELCRRVEGLELGVDAEALASALAEVREQWDRIARHDDELAQRFAAACERVRERLVRYEEEQAEQQTRAEAARQAVEARTALCVRLEAAEGADLHALLAAAEAEWEALPPSDEPECAELAQRFERDAQACRDQYAERQSAGEKQQRLLELCADLEKRLEAGETGGVVSLRGEARTLARASGIEAELSGRAGEIESRWAQIDDTRRAERAARAEEARQTWGALCEKVETLAALEAPGLGEARNALRDSRAALESPPELPKAERDALVARLRAARAVLYPKVQELLDADEWRRWGNAAVQQELCTQVEALRERQDLDAVAKELSALRERWKGAAVAPRDQAEALWQRFKTARDEVQARVEAHLAQRAEEHAANLAKKRELCEKAEALKDSTDWAKTAEALKGLQAEWKQIGPVSRRHSNAIWKRFRAACDHFFEARKSDLQRRREEWAGNLAKKRELCEKAEALKDSTDWEASAALIKTLQAEWKQVGPVRRDRSEAIWQRFRAACDAFFERYRRRDAISREQEQSGREELCEELEALADGDGAAQDLRDRVEAIHERWRAGGRPRGDRSGLAERYATARRRVVESHPAAFRGTDLDPEANCTRAEKLIARVERLVAAGPAAQDLAARLQEALASNTIGGSESRRRHDEELQAVQAAWSRLGPLGAAGHELQQRFRDACRRASGSAG